VSCFPLNSVTAALGVTHVDYLSLDVEGPELEILATVDWTRLRVDVITVEYRVRLRPPPGPVLPLVGRLSGVPGQIPPPVRCCPGGSSRPGGWVITVEYRVRLRPPGPVLPLVGRPGPVGGSSRWSTASWSASASASTDRRRSRSSATYAGSSAIRALRVEVLYMYVPCARSS